MYFQPGFQGTVKQEVMDCLRKKTSLSQEVTEKSHRGLSIIYCKRWRRQQTQGQTTPQPSFPVPAQMGCWPSPLDR